MEAFELRLWDGRLGRWLSVDPYGQYDSPYLGMGNNPMSMIDPDGGFAEEGGDPPGFFGRLWNRITGNTSSEYQSIQQDDVAWSVALDDVSIQNASKESVPCNLCHHNAKLNTTLNPFNYRIGILDYISNNQSGYIDSDGGTMNGGFTGDITGKFGELYGVANPFMSILMGTGIDRVNSSVVNGFETGIDVYTQGGSIYNDLNEKEGPST